jgi:hypothetical protein
MNAQAVGALVGLGQQATALLAGISAMAVMMSKPKKKEKKCRT